MNGDSNIGVWFFQQNIVPLTDGTFGPGQHQNGDIFAVSAFTTGGTNPTISVYKWNTACTKAIKNPLPAIVNGVLVNTPPNTCADTNLELQFASASGSSCILGSSDTACAATNATGPITVSWPYASKFGGSNSVVPTGGFFEGGIDITELFGGIPGLKTEGAWATDLGYGYSVQLSEYLSKCARFISGDRKNNPGFKYELIYSDPPQ